MFLPRAEENFFCISYKELFFLVLWAYFKDLSIWGLLVLLVGSFSADFLSEFSVSEEQVLKVFLCHHGVSRDLPANTCFYNSCFCTLYCSFYWRNSGLIRMICCSISFWNISFEMRSTYKRHIRCCRESGRKMAFGLGPPEFKSWLCPSFAVCVILGMFFCLFAFIFSTNILLWRI